MHMYDAHVIGTSICMSDRGVVESKVGGYNVSYLVFIFIAAPHPDLPDLRRAATRIYITCPSVINQLHDWTETRVARS